MKVYNAVKLYHCQTSYSSFIENERSHEKYTPQTENLELIPEYGRENKIGTLCINIVLRYMLLTIVAVKKQ